MISVAGADTMVLGNGQYVICCYVTKPEEILKVTLFLSDKNAVDNYVNKAMHYLVENYASDVVCKKHIHVYSRK